MCEFDKGVEPQVSVVEGDALGAHCVEIVGQESLCVRFDEVQPDAEFWRSLLLPTPGTPDRTTS